MTQTSINTLYTHTTSLRGPGASHSVSVVDGQGRSELNDRAQVVQWESRALGNFQVGDVVSYQAQNRFDARLKDTLTYFFVGVAADGRAVIGSAWNVSDITPFYSYEVIDQEQLSHVCRPKTRQCEIKENLPLFLHWQEYSPMRDKCFTWITDHEGAGQRFYSDERKRFLIEVCGVTLDGQDTVLRFAPNQDTPYENAHMRLSPEEMARLIPA